MAFEAIKPVSRRHSGFSPVSTGALKRQPMESADHSLRTKTLPNRSLMKNTSGLNKNTMFLHTLVWKVKWSVNDR